MRQELPGHFRHRGASGNLSYVVRDPLTGRLRWFALGTDDEKEARGKALGIYAKLSAGAVADDRNARVAAWMRRWLEDKGHELRPRSMERYEAAIELIVGGLGKHTLGDLRPSHVQSWMRGMLAAGRSPWMVDYAHSVLRGALRSAVRLELIARDPTDAVRPPRVERHAIEPWTREETEGFLREAVAHRLHALWVLALSSGMRRGELLGLRWSDIDLDGATLTVRQQVQRTKDGLEVGPVKTRRGERTISLTPAAVEHLRSWLDELIWEQQQLGILGKMPLCFPTAVGKPTDPRSLKSQFDRILQRAGLRSIRLHDLRHTHASLMIATGQIDPKVLQARLGHESIRTTYDLYGHLFEGAQRTAVEAFSNSVETPAPKGRASKSVSKHGTEAEKNA